MSLAGMTVTLDRAAGTAELRLPSWSRVIPIGELRAELEFYRRLWGRGSKVKNGPGPWARFYEADVRALEAAVREAQDYVG
jgi:hypothetical protein